MTIAADLANPDFWGLPEAERSAAFERFQAASTLTRVAGVDDTYALTRYKDVAEASRNPEIFSSFPVATGIYDPPPGTAEMLGSMISMDDPKHARMRRIVSRAFTPKMLKKVEHDVERTAARIVDRLIETGPCDFVEQVATPLPLKVICDMAGIPDSEFASVVENSDNVAGAVGDPGYVAPDGRNRKAAMLDGLSYLHGLMKDLAELRRRKPADDLVTALVNATVDGETLNDRELGKFFLLLVVAGNETTRNLISHGLHLLTVNPDQRAMLLDELDTMFPRAIEEIVRYSSPVRWMRRTLTREHDMGGCRYQAGDRVLLCYSAANRDGSVFADAGRFDITRFPNPHVAFGAPGPHFCLGANLARRETTVMFRELFTRLPGLHAAGDPVPQRSNFLNGLLRLDCAF